MNEKREFIKENTCCVSGHRKVKNDLNIEKIKNIFLELIEKKYDTFLVGMALGFDTICFNILEKIREEKNIKIVACIPCREQDYRFSEMQKKEYKRMLRVADEKIYISDNYNAWCMQKRNEYMVNNSSVLVYYLREYIGGTFNTVKYAEKENVELIKI